MKYEVHHMDGTRSIIEATNEDMARQFAMDKKWGPPSQNRTWPCGSWNGFGLTVERYREEKQFVKAMEMEIA